MYFKSRKNYFFEILIGFESLIKPLSLSSSTLLIKSFDFAHRCLLSALTPRNVEFEASILIHPFSQIPHSFSVEGNVWMLLLRECKIHNMTFGHQVSKLFLKTPKIVFNFFNIDPQIEVSQSHFIKKNCIFIYLYAENLLEQKMHSKHALLF